MTQEDQREQMVQRIANLLRTTSFKFEFKVVKKPKGINVIQEVTQEEMDEILRMASRGNMN